VCVLLAVCSCDKRGLAAAVAGLGSMRTSAALHSPHDDRRRGGPKGSGHRWRGVYCHRRARGAEPLPAHSEPVQGKLVLQMMLGDLEDKHQMLTM
jgi:hypothetical protein